MKRMLLAVVSGLFIFAPAFADETGGGTPSNQTQTMSVKSVVVEEAECTILDWLLGECE